MKENLNNIHEGTMKILEEVGIKFIHEEILEILRHNNIKVLDNIAYFKRDQIMKWVGKAPGTFKIYARNSKHDMLIGGDHTEFLSCNSGFPFIADFDGNLRAAKYDDYITFLKLVQQTPHFNINGGVMVTPCDIDQDNLYQIMLNATLNHSDKCIFGGMGGQREAEMTMDMLNIVFGGKEELLAKPRIVAIISSASPLMFDKTMLETMLVYVRSGQPVIIAPAVMAGTTGPVSIGGAIAISNAESLAGIAVVQMIREGAPVIYGSATSVADMKNGSFCIGAPESALAVTYCAGLAKHYGVPCRGGGTLTDAKSVSIQAGYEGMMVLLTAAQEKMNFILHSAGGLGSYESMCFEKYIADVEMVGMVKRVVEGVSTDENAIPLEVIKTVGIGGEFLTHEHTVTNFRKHTFIPDVSVRGAIQKGETPNGKLLTNINKKKEKMLKKYKKPELPRDIQSKLMEYLKDNHIDCTGLV